jgi:hypothetical protein
MQRGANVRGQNRLFETRGTKIAQLKNLGGQNCNLAKTIFFVLV